MNYILYPLAAIGAYRVWQGICELWRTRHDKPTPWFWWRRQ